MSHNLRSEHLSRGSNTEHVRGSNELRTDNNSHDYMRHEPQQNVHRRRNRVVEWTSRLLAIDYDRNAE